VNSTQSERSTSVKVFEAPLAAHCPETARLLRAAALAVHPRVTAITLHGSRGPAGGYRADSDVDLCLIVDVQGVTQESALAALLRVVLNTTLDHWQGTVEADLAAAYDRQGCGLTCFEGPTWDDVQCTIGGQDCFGLYKLQRGFDGFVEQGVALRLMFPCMVIWRREDDAATHCISRDRSARCPP
jgi:hypothetical protein